VALLFLLAWPLRMVLRLRWVALGFVAGAAWAALGLHL
jgi:hypothetical protein